MLPKRTFLTGFIARGYHLIWFSRWFFLEKLSQVTTNFLFLFVETKVEIKIFFQKNKKTPLKKKLTGLITGIRV